MAMPDGRSDNIRRFHDAAAPMLAELDDGLAPISWISVGHFGSGRCLLSVTDVAIGETSFAESTVRLAAAGDDAACARLVEEHFGPMVRAAYVVAGDPEVAREAVQMAWAAAWPRLGSA